MTVYVPGEDGRYRRATFDGETIYLDGTSVAAAGVHAHRRPVRHDERHWLLHLAACLRFGAAAGGAGASGKSMRHQGDRLAGMAPLIDPVLVEVEMKLAPTWGG
jgi:hypothetical protein